MSKLKAKNPKNDRAAAIADKIAEQVRTLILRNWGIITPILNEEEGGEGEIKLAFGTTISDRSATPGEEADKDNRIKTTLSFSAKHSDKIEAAIPDPDQMELGETKTPADPDLEA